MMHPDPDRRVQGYEELIARIDQLLALAPAGVGQPRRKVKARWWLVIAAVVVFALLVAVVWASVRSVGPKQAAVVVGEYASDGTQDALFDGLSLDGWAMAGAWSADNDDEGTPVLIGSGTLRRQFADYPDYRLTVGLDLYEASAAEVQFAVSSTQGADRRFVLRLTQDRGAVFGTRDGERGAFQPTSPAVAFPSANWLKGRRPYLEVRVERGGGVWSVWFHGEPVARVPDDGTVKLPEFRLTAFDGRARVDTVILERLHLVGP